MLSDICRQELENVALVRWLDHQWEMFSGPVSGRIFVTAGYLAIETYESIRQSPFPLPLLDIPNGSYLTPKSTSLFISKSGQNMGLEKASEYSFSVSSTSQQALQSYRYH